MITVLQLGGVKKVRLVEMSVVLRVSKAVLKMWRERERSVGEPRA